MSDSQEFDSKNAEEWIRQQRERLKAECASKQADGALSETWINAMREWLKLFGSAGPMFSGQTQAELSQTLQGLGIAQQGLMDALGKLPLLGLFANQFEPWTRLQAADAEFRKVEQQFREAVIDVHLRALDELERKLKMRGAGAPTERELYDLWIECGESVFTKVAHSAEFARLQGEMSNAAVRRLREHQQVIEQIAKALDLPTRTELNSVHRQLRTLREELDRTQALRTQDRGPKEEQNIQRGSGARAPRQGSPKTASNGKAARKTATRKPRKVSR
jgi:class III poly(R)-hydroxyalkanoic acid synthase PhaE subunit